MTKENASIPVSRKKKKHRTLKVLLIIAVVLLILRLILPFFVLNYVNGVLAQSKQFPGHVEDVDLALIRGAYVIKGIRIDKADTATGKRDSIPFFTCPAIDLSVEWGALLKGRIVGEIELTEPRLNFVKDAPDQQDIKQDTSDFRDVLKKMMPLKVNRFGISKGRIHYMDPYSKPPVDVAISNIRMIATNLSNTNKSNEFLPATLEADAEAYGGKLRLDLKFDALQKQPTFDMSAKIDEVSLADLNSFFKAYGKFDVHKGSFGLYTEFAAKEGKFNGYVKPIIRDLKVVDWGDDKNIGAHLWETVVGGVAELLENQPKDQIATKIPISGRFENPDIALWRAVNYVFRNAFVLALKPSIDHTIDIGKVEEPATEKKTFLQKVFGKKEDKKEDP